MRPFLIRLHRYAGLFTAAFLFVAGLTGAVIEWNGELDDLLNADLTRVASRGRALPAPVIARQVEARYPRAEVTYLPLAAEPGHALPVYVEPRVDPRTGAPYALDFNEVLVDPVTGRETGTRSADVWPVTRRTLIPFLYTVHYSLHLPARWGGAQWGIWLMGAVACVWVLDCFVGAYLTLPPRRARRALAGGRSWWRRWRPAWTVARGATGFKRTYDLHRVAGLWPWALLLGLAVSAVSLNLRAELFLPLVSRVARVTPTPYDTRHAAATPVVPAFGLDSAVALAHTEAVRRGWREPPGAISYAAAYGMYDVRFYAAGGESGPAGGGPPSVILDARDGRVLAGTRPWTGTAGDVFVQAQFPVHSGRILGLAGRILITIIGLVVATLSVTGVVIWARKRRARLAREHRRAPAAIGGANAGPVVAARGVPVGH